MRESARDDEVGRGDGEGRGGGVTDMRTEEAFIRVRHVFPRWLHSRRFSRERTLLLEVAQSGLIEREISPQTNREVVMRKFLL